MTGARPPGASSFEVRLPDLGTPGEVTVLEVLVKVGDQVEKEQALLTLESEKATMDVPATVAGRELAPRGGRGTHGSHDPAGRARGPRSPRARGPRRGPHAAGAAREAALLRREPVPERLLMDGKKMMKAFLIGDKSIFAIPGGCHPLVASPVSELLYLWGLAGKGETLMMKDHPEFDHLKSFEEFFKEREGAKLKRTLSHEKFKALCAPYSFTEEQKRLLLSMLKEKEYCLD